MKAEILWIELDPDDESTLPPEGMRSYVLVVKLIGREQRIGSDGADYVRGDVITTKRLGGVRLFTHWAHMPKLPPKSKKKYGKFS